MHIVGMLLIGLVVGLIARALMPGPDPMGFVLTAILGIVGSVLATYLGQAMNLYPEGHPAGLVASVVGAIIVLGVYHLFTRRRKGLVQ